MSKPISKEEADKRYDAMIGKVNDDFGKGIEREKKKLAKTLRKYDPDEGMREIPLEHREKHLKD